MPEALPSCLDRCCPGWRSSTSTLILSLSLSLCCLFFQPSLSRRPCSRPKTVSDVASQAEVVRTLQSSIKSGDVRVFPLFYRFRPSAPCCSPPVLALSFSPPRNSSHTCCFTARQARAKPARRWRWPGSFLVTKLGTARRNSTPPTNAASTLCATKSSGSHKTQ